MNMKDFYIKTLPLITSMFLTNGFSQLPIEVNHPSQILIKKYSALGDIPLEFFGNNSISKIDANKFFSNYENDIVRIHKRDIQTAKVDSSYTNTILKHKINYFIKGLTKIDFNKPKEFLYQSISESASMWISWREKIISQPFSERNNGTLNDFQFLDEFSVNGIINNNIYISSKFSMFRHSGKFIWVSNVYNNEWVKYFPAIDMNFWYANQTSFYIKNPAFDIEIANSPFSWGWSSGRSPILAADAIPFNRISLYKNIGSLQLEYFHGSLLSTSIRNIHLSNIKEEKYIAGHRAQIKFNKNFHASLSELVVYGNRSPEIGYLNPISFFWAKEHNLGDLDNILIAFDFGYRMKPGTIVYSTLVIDELSWQDIMSDWWGNKYSYQIGLFLTSSNLSIPDLRVEYNVTRPWTYTHPDFSYAHRDKSLGSSYGPSSKAIRIESFYFPIPKIIIESSFEHVLKGMGNGANVSDNYDNRNEDLDWDTKFFLDDKQKFTELNISFNYILSDLLRLRSTISISETFNPYLYSESRTYSEEKFILGVDFSW